MFRVLIIANLIAPCVIAFQNPNNVSEFYTSGVGDKLEHQTYYNNTGFAVVSIPFTFRSNNYNPPLDAGYYEVEPVIQSEIPTKILLRQIGKIKGVVTVIDYNVLNYERDKPAADVTLIDDGRKAQLTLKSSKYEIFAIIEFNNITP